MWIKEHYIKPTPKALSFDPYIETFINSHQKSLNFQYMT